MKTQIQKMGYNDIAKHQHLLDIEQVKPIDSLGKPFDRDYHYAISTIEKNDTQDDQIVDEIKKRIYGR